MKDRTFIKPDLFSQAPMLSLLPVLSQVEKLKAMQSFFYARYEKVAAIKENSHEKINDFIQAEYSMLIEILDWLKMKPAKDQE